LTKCKTRLRWLGNILRKEDCGNEMSKENVCRRKERKRWLDIIENDIKISVEV